jgi:two pore calcium channel protein
MLLAGLMLEVGYQKFNGLYDYISKSENICRLLLVVFCVIELGLAIVNMIVTSPDIHHQNWLVWSALLAVTYVFWFDLTSRWKLEVVVRIVPRLVTVLAVFMLFVVLCASFGPFIFSIHSIHDDDDYNQRYFSTFTESVWSVFVAITSSSFPNQVMPLYRQYHAFILYIIAFVTLGAFGALNFILVFVLAEYRKVFDRFSVTSNELREGLMLRAFDLLDTDRRGWLTYSQTSALLEELYTHYGDFLRFGK